MKLSILICTIESRQKQFEVLLHKLQSQSMQGVEILHECDNKQISIGRKRQILLERAKGDYVVFIDDDDDVAEDYVKLIMQAIEQDPDCIGFLIECTMKGRKKIAIASNKYEDWGEKKDGYDFVRTIYHKTPVKRWIALKVGFKDIRFGEDYLFAMGLKLTGLLKKEVLICEYLYHYIYTYENPLTKYGEIQNVRH